MVMRGLSRVQNFCRQHMRMALPFGLVIPLPPLPAGAASLIFSHSSLNSMISRRCQSHDAQIARKRKEGRKDENLQRGRGHSRVKSRGTSCAYRLFLRLHLRRQRRRRRRRWEWEKFPHREVLLSMKVTLFKRRGRKSQTCTTHPR